MRKPILTAVLAVAVFNVASQASTTKYLVADIGTLVGTTSQANGINDIGQVVGGSGHPFLYSNGTMTDLGTFGGNSGNAFAINSNGQIVGDATIASGFLHAFLSSNGSMSDLGTLGGSNSRSNDINDSGQIVGSASTASNAIHAFLYTNGNMSDLGTLGGASSSANGINASGEIVGSASTADNHQHAFLYSNGSMEDLGTLVTGGSSVATRINTNGQIVGNASIANGNLHAFIYMNGTMTDLGTLGGPTSSAADINASGQVVGTADIALNTSHAFLYSNGTMNDLNNLLVPGTGWTLTAATGINAHAQIVGYGTNPSHQSHGFLATPSSGTLSLADGGSPNDNPAKENIVVTGSNGSYSSTVLDTAVNSNTGSVDILGIPNPVTDRPVIVLMDLLNSDSDFIANLTAPDGSRPFTILSDASTGSDLVEWDSIKNLYGQSWDLAVRYDSFANPSSSNALDFTWDFSINPDVTVDKLAVVPEPSAISLLAIGSIAGMRRRRKA